MANWNYTCKNGKAQRKELNEKMLEKMRKDKEKILKLKEKIQQVDLVLNIKLILQNLMMSIQQER